MRKQDYYEPIIGRESEPRRRPKKKKKRANRGERVVVTLLSLLFLTVAIVATVKYVVRAPEPVTDNEDQQTQQDGTAEDSDAIQTISNGKERKKYCYTILAYGVDNDAGGSDTNMLVRFDAENKPGVSNLLAMLCALTGEPMDKTVESFAGKGYGDLKSTVADAIIATLEPIQADYNRYMGDKAYLETVYRQGAERAGRLAERTLSKAMKKIGFIAK